MSHLQLRDPISIISFSRYYQQQQQQQPSQRRVSGLSVGGVQSQQLKAAEDGVMPTVSGSRRKAHAHGQLTQVRCIRRYIFTARRLAKRGICRHRVSVCVCVCLSHSGIVSKRLNVGSRK